MKNSLLILLFSLHLGCTSTPPKDNSDYKRIVGRTVKIHNLEIAQFDFPYKLDWISAKNACQNMGNGWRLPTVDEFDLLIRYNNKLENYVTGYYWTSQDDESCCSMVREISGKNEPPRRYYLSKDNKHWVRAVRNF